jgi:hypothetical protein
MAKGNTNVILNNQNIADGNVAGSLTHITDGSVKFKQGLPSGISDKEIKLAFNFRNSFKQGNTASAVNDFFKNLEAQFKSIKYGSDSILFWVVRKKYSYREITKFSSSGGFFSQGLLPRLFPSMSRQVGEWWNQGSSGLLNNPLVQATSSTLGISTSVDIGATTDLKSFFDVTSDSIGVMANTKYMQLDSTLPLIDITQERYGVPIPFSASSENKISPTTRNIMFNLSKFNTALMRRNLIPVAYGNTTVTANLAVDATLAHGVNLINDLPTFVKLNTGVKALVFGLKAAISDIRIFRYISYLGNIGNKSGFNYRDNRPATAADKDFIVLSGEEQAAGILNEINEIASLSQAQALVQKAAQGDIINNFFQSRGSQIITPSGGVVRSEISSGEIITESSTLPELPPSEFIDDIPAATDGNTFNAAEARLDWDGSPNAKIYSGPAIGQFKTSYRVQDGFLNGETDIFVVAPTMVRGANGRYVYDSSLGAQYPLGTVVYVTNKNGTTVRAIIGDNGPAENGWGEVSGRLAQTLGIPIVTTEAGRRVTGGSGHSLTFQLDPTTRVPNGSLTRSGLTSFLNNVQGTQPTQPINNAGVNAAAQAIINSRNVNSNVTAAEEAAATRTIRGQTVIDTDAFFEDTANEDQAGTAPAPQPATAPAALTTQYDSRGLEIIESELPSEGGQPAGQYDAFFTDVPVETQQSAPVASTPSSTPTEQQGSGAVSAPGVSSIQTAQNEQAQSSTDVLAQMTTLLDSLGAGKYSNRQKSDIYTFFINVEGVYQKVDYLLKRISAGLNPCKSIIQRLSTSATPALTNAIDTSSPATASSQLALLGIPSQFADLGGELLQGVFSGENTTNILAGAISDQFTNFTDPLAENPWASAYDDAAGGLNQLGGLVGGADFAGGLLPTSSELLEALDPGLFLEELKIPSILPSVDLGSIKDLLSLAASVATSGPPTSLTGLIKMQEQLYSIICNFELPLITFPDLEALLKMKFKDVKQMVIDMVTKFVERILDQFNILKLLKNMKKTFKQLLEEIKQKIVEQLFSCEKYKKADKSGKPSVGG